MIAHDLRLVHAAKVAARPPRPVSHPLAGLDSERLSRRLVVYTPNAVEMDALLSRARKDISGLTSSAVVHRVMAYNPDAFWAIARRSRFDALGAAGEGFLAFLMLNEAGMKGLIDGSLNTKDPDPAALTQQNERPAGIYVWAVHARGVIAGGIPLALEKVWTPLYREANLYARAVTPDGTRILEALGFRIGATFRGGVAPHLHMYQRGRPSPEELPSYDSYRARGTDAEIAVTVAHSAETVMQAVAIRGAVYIGEQECPYSEEFDGNDFAATHLIGYVGEEPVSCIRLRFFADFAKIERLAVRREYRHRGLASKLVEAAVDLCRAKGYQRFYAHSQKRLVGFWRRFGFKPLDGRREFVFSDFDYIEVVLDVSRSAGAIALGVDPYVTIRPEGRWHTPGVLERSASRPATQPSARRAIA
jgi:predicted GNAT family N-acyltransferase